MCIIYLDTEYDNDGNIIEIGALCISNGKVLREFHCLIRNKVSNLYYYNRCAQHSHCIHVNTLSNYGIMLDEALRDFQDFISLAGSEVVHLRGHGQDMLADNLTRLFPFLREMHNIIYEQVSLPKWNQRQHESWFIGALRMKSCSKLYACNSNYHAMQYLPNWKLFDKEPTHTQIVKYLFNFHCALIDAYILSFYEETLPTYCCDMHFKHVFVTPNENNTVYVHDCTNIFEELK